MCTCWELCCKGLTTHYLIVYDTMIEFKKVTDISHLDEIFAVYSAAILTMEQDGIFQWDEFYPYP